MTEQVEELEVLEEEGTVDPTEWRAPVPSDDERELWWLDEAYDPPPGTFMELLDRLDGPEQRREYARLHWALDDVGLARELERHDVAAAFRRDNPGLSWETAWAIAGPDPHGRFAEGASLGTAAW